MSLSNKKTFKKQKVPYSPEITSPIVEEVKSIINSLNHFLKQYFDFSMGAPEKYAILVKQYFVDQSTNSSYSCFISSMFSKISNMLQPFLQKVSIPPIEEENKLREQLDVMTSKIEKQKRKIKQLKLQINKYREVSNKLTNFIYMLRLSDLDIDSLYKKTIFIGNNNKQEKQQLFTEVSDFQTR